MEFFEETIAWITGGGSGIGRSAAMALASEGTTVVLSGRREAQLKETAKLVTEAGGTAVVEPLDVTDGVATKEVATRIGKAFNRLDILVNSAGANVRERSWAVLSPGGVETVFGPTVHGAFNCVIAALPLMRARRNGLIFNIASNAGKTVTVMAGASYAAAKHAVIAMNTSINMEECVNGIRACAICPGEVVTAFLDLRPVPVKEEDRARMLKPEDIAQAILFVARIPSHACISEIAISPTWDRGYVAALQQAHARKS